MVPTVELSIIVPTLNEADTLPALFRTLAEQQGVGFELIICDGGSQDGTQELARQLGAKAPFACRVLTSAAGRAFQMNAGADSAAGELFLFLHADSAFADVCALQQGIAALHRQLRRRGDRRVAGRFALRFRRQQPDASLGYFFYEGKARLDRSGCLHGDQGFLLRQDFFAEVGPFDGRLGVLEDDLFAALVWRQGEWLLLPAEIHTSARRFEIEGLAERQILNALLMNCAAIGWEAFFQAAPGIYRQHRGAGRLRLAPFFRLVRTLLRPLPVRQRLRLWYDTGTYVRANAWQLAYWLDARRAFRQELPPGAVATPTLTLFDRCFDTLTDHPPGRLAAALLTWVWFQVYGRLLPWRDEQPAAGAEKGS